MLQVQLGVRGKITFSLVNDEHLPFAFVLDKTSYDGSGALLAASGGKPLVDIQPASGTVPANSKVHLTHLLMEPFHAVWLNSHVDWYVMHEQVDGCMVHVHLQHQELC